MADESSRSPALAATVLIVDDEPAIVRTLKVALERGVKGVRVLTASHAKEALDVLDRERVDVLVSDYRMPGMTGYELLVEARRRAPAVVRILMTAYPEDPLAVRAIHEARLDHFFSKPIHLAEFVAVVMGMLDAEKTATAALPADRRV